MLISRFRVLSEGGGSALRARGSADEDEAVAESAAIGIAAAAEDAIIGNGAAGEGPINGNGGEVAEPVPP